MCIATVCVVLCCISAELSEASQLKPPLYVICTLYYVSMVDLVTGINCFND